MKLALGTVQFGMDYGIRGQCRPKESEAVRMLEFAVEHGIDNIDTADAYGCAEEIVGTFLKKSPVPREKLTLISKLLPHSLDDVPEERYFSVIRTGVLRTLERMRTDYLDVFLFHTAEYVFDPAKLDALAGLKREGLVRATGVSVYEVEEARAGILNPAVDFLQMPCSICDQRMERAGIFEFAARHGTRIHTRSAFLQGLLLMTEEEVPEFLKRARPMVTEIQRFCHARHLSPVEVALGYVRRLAPAVSQLVFGVDCMEQLKEDIQLFERPVDIESLEELGRKFTDLEADIVMPSLWKRAGK